MRKCFLHIGRHKTGSSAIQWTLHHHREELKRRGYLYPKTGIPGKAVAHYDVAWELRKSGRHFGIIDDLIAEIGTSRHHVVISCEDFSIAIQSFEEFQAFIDCLRNCGLDVVVVCYVRNPHDYLRSAFLELLKTKFPLGFSGFTTAILDDELVTWKDHSAIGRDRCVESLVRLSESGDASVVVRSYDDVSEAVVADFFAIMGLTFAEFSGTDEPRRNEANATEQALALLFRNVTGRNPDHREHALITAIGAVAPMRSLHIGESAWRLIAQKYQPELEVLASRFGVRLANPPRRVAGDVGLEEVFSETMVRSIQAAARLLADTADAQDRAYQDVVAHYRAAIAERDALAAERDSVAAERDRAYQDVVAHYRAAIGERNALAAERDKLTAERDRAYREVVAHYTAAIGQRDAMAAERDQLSFALDTVLRSRSWRITAPLRTMLARVGKWRR